MFKQLAAWTRWQTPANARPGASSSKPIDYNKFVYWLCRVQFHLIRSPAISRSQLAAMERLARASGRPEARLGQFSKPFSVRFVCTILMYAAINIKYLEFVYGTFSSFDFYNTEQNLREVPGAPPGTLVEFLCLQTNCSSLSSRSAGGAAGNLTDPAGLANELLQLPVFLLCLASWPRWTYSPLVAGNVLCTMLATTLLFWSCLSCVFLPVYNALVQASSKPTRLLLLPELTVELERVQRERELAQLEAGDRYALHGCLPGDSGRPAADVEDSLAINVTSWWRHRLAKSFSQTTICLLTSWLLSVGVTQIWVVLELIQPQQAKYLDYLEHMRASRCSIWRKHDAKPLRQADLLQPWNLWTLAEQFLLIHVPLYSLVFMVCTLFQTISDIKLCIVDLRLQLRVAIELSKIRQQSKHFEAPRMGPRVERRAPRPVGLTPAAAAATTTAAKLQSPMAAIRAKLCAQLDYSWSILRQKRRLAAGPQLDLDGTHRELARSIASSQAASQSAEWHADFLRKLTANFMSLRKDIEASQRPMSALFVYCYVCNYGFSLMCVYAVHRIKNSLTVAGAICLSIYCTTAVVLIVASTIHTNARKLIPLFRALIGLNLRETNPQLCRLTQCMDSLVEATDSSGGLAIKAFGLKVTYTSVIQILLWTSSIQLLAFGR